jgi:predicted esterase
MNRLQCNASTTLRLTVWLVAALGLVWPVTAVVRGGESEVRRSAEALAFLEQYLAQPAEERGPLAEQPLAALPLTREHAEAAEKRLWQDHAQRIRQTRQAEMQARQLVDGELQMPFYYEVFGEKPERGRSLYISLHGGGGTTANVNDQQWENQKRLYRPAEGVYLVPRAPTNAWNLWHQPHIDRMFDRLIENLIILEDVDPDRVYVLGYSAGGDGVFQLAPRMADRWAAAAMMAGHPNETSPLGLRNIAFTLHMGGNDAAYGRNQVARDWEKKLAELQQADPQGYVHWVKIYEGKGHWMDREDAAAVPWMAGHRRNPLPERIVWRQDDVTHARFYWLAVPPDDCRGGATVVASRREQTINVQQAEGVSQLTVRLNDRLCDLDRPVRVQHDERILFEGHVPRTLATLATTLAERGDPQAVFSGQVTVSLTQPSGPP